MGLSLTCSKSTREERKDPVSLLTLAKALCFPHSWPTARKRRKRKLYFSLCFAKNLSYSLSALVEVGITLSLLAKNKKKRCSFYLNLSIFLSKQKIKEEVTKASLLLANMKVVSDKTWGRAQHLMQETWGNKLKVLDVGKLQKPTIHNCHQNFKLACVTK